MNNTITCPICKTKFTPRRSTARYCSDRCRKSASRSAATATQAPAGALLSVTSAVGTYNHPADDLVTLISQQPRASKPPSKAILDRRIVPDEKWPGMYRIRRPDGTVTDMVNLTRARDALRSWDEALGMNTPARDRPTFVVVLRPEPHVDPIKALRHALKRLLRDYGMRAIAIDVEHHGDADDDH
jgi:hypothetical protein